MPRIQMSLIVAATGCSGFLAAVALLALGLETIWLRYALAVVVAYLVFLGCVWLWLTLARRTTSPDLDPLDLLNVSASDGSATGVDIGGGGVGFGDFGGAGASSSFTTPQPPSPSGDTSGGGGLGFDLSFDELLWLLVLAAAVLAAAVAAVYVVATAPSFFAEVLLDGVLSVGLYRRLNRIRHKHWLEGALRRTALPFAIVLVFFAIAGATMHAYAPHARSIGGVWEHFLANRS